MFWFLFYFNVSPAKWYNAGAKQPHEYCIRQSQSVNKRRRCVKFFMRSSFSTEEKQNIRAWSIWHVLLKVSANLPFSLFPHKQRQQQLTSSEVTFAQVNSTKPETNNLLLYTGRTRSSTCFIFYPLSAFRISKWTAALKRNLEIYILLLLHSSVTFLFWMMDSHPNSAFSVKVIKFRLLYEAPFLCLVFWTFLNSSRWAKRHTGRKRGPFLIEFKDRCCILKFRL